MILYRLIAMLCYSITSTFCFGLRAFVSCIQLIKALKLKRSTYQLSYVMYIAQESWCDWNFCMLLIFVYCICIFCIQNLNDWNFAQTLTLPHAANIKYGQLASLVFCQIFEWPTQRLMVSRLIEIEIKKAKPGERSPCCATGHRWAAWVWSAYKI